jgi:hypothetical protein
MGQSTNGQICFGILFPEDYKLPWKDSSEEDWWRTVNGYKPPFELYNSQGEYLNGKKPPQSEIDQYYQAQREFDDNNPFPFELVNYCSLDCPMYILAIKESVKTAYRGYPEEISPQTLVEQYEWKTQLNDFAEKYINTSESAEEEIDLTPKWYLSSYWG